MENGFKSRRNNLFFLHTYWKYKIGRVEKDDVVKREQCFRSSKRRLFVVAVDHFEFRTDEIQANRITTDLLTGCFVTRVAILSTLSTQPTLQHVTLNMIV